MDKEAIQKRRDDRQQALQLVYERMFKDDTFEDIRTDALLRALNYIKMKLTNSLKTISKAGKSTEFQKFPLPL